MALSEAQRIAKQKYEKNLKRDQVAFHGTETDLIEYQETKVNKAGFIKQLIREAMEKEQESAQRCILLGKRFGLGQLKYKDISINRIDPH